MGAFRGGKRREEGVGRLIEGGGVGRPDGKNLQILDLHRLASLDTVEGLHNCRAFSQLPLCLDEAM